MEASNIPHSIEVLVSSSDESVDIFLGVTTKGKMSQSKALAQGKSLSKPPAQGKSKPQ